MTPDENREALRELAIALRKLLKLDPLHSPIPHRLAAYAADAIDAFLSGEFSTLDAAFGVNPGPGRPPVIDPEREQMKARAWQLKRIGELSWLKVADKLQEEFPRRDPLDESTIRGWFENDDTYWVEELTRRLAAGDK